MAVVAWKSDLGTGTLLVLAECPWDQKIKKEMTFFPPWFLISLIAKYLIKSITCR